MDLPIKPSRGGFLRPFSCGWFIREFLPGNGPYDTPRIDCYLGASQADIFSHYRNSRRFATAQDKAIKLEEKQARKQQRSIEPSNIEKLTLQ